MRIVVRFDDICPTMNWRRWDVMEEVLDRHRIVPLLAIVPDNRDRNLMVDPANETFWDRARAWQSKGWVIGLHGCTHIHDSSDGGLYPWWDRSEFAGHPEDVQRSRIEKGLSILSQHGLQTRVWVSPSHAFDGTTLEVLRDLGITTNSDGIGYRAYRDRSNMVHVPLLPWWSRSWGLPVGTLCIHLNSAPSMDRLIDDLKFIRRVALGCSFTFEQLVKSARTMTLADHAFQKTYWRTWRLRNSTLNRLRGYSR